MNEPKTTMDRVRDERIAGIDAMTEEYADSATKVRARYVSGDATAEKTLRDLAMLATSHAAKVRAKLKGVT